MPASTTFPPTPAPSTDIRGKEDDRLPPIDTTFALPPSAVNSSKHTARDIAAAALGSPISPANSRKQSTTQLAEISLPPPPARSRKIIQVKPKGSSEERDSTYTPTAKATKATATKESGKRKSAGGTAATGTAAGRKVARKTAHSIIERRRRSKMNEEFGVLKDLIPACSGCEMHKLAILQASIEYLRYLEKCVTDLKAGRASSSEAPSLPRPSSSPDADEDVDGPVDPASDDEMEVDDAHVSQLPAVRDCPPTAPGTSSTALSAMSPLAHHRSLASSTNPSTLPSPYFGPVSSHSSVDVFSNATTPTFGPYFNQNPHRHSSSRGSISHQSFNAPPTPQHPFQTYSRTTSAQTSPIIFPQHQGLNEAEASSALLMLNQDRRRSSMLRDGERRGMSVKDLLRN